MKVGDQSDVFLESLHSRKTFMEEVWTQKHTRPKITHTHTQTQGIEWWTARVLLVIREQWSVECLNINLLPFLSLFCPYNTPSFSLDLLFIDFSFPAFWLNKRLFFTQDHTVVYLVLLKGCIMKNFQSCQDLYKSLSLHWCVPFMLFNTPLCDLAMLLAEQHLCHALSQLTYLGFH